MINGFGFTLIAAPTEKPLDDLRRLQAMSRILRQAAESFDRETALDLQASADTNVYAHLGSMLSLAAQKGLPPLAAALGTWIAARAGRKVKIKVGDVEIEATNADEVKDLLAQAQAFKQANEPKRIHER